MANLTAPVYTTIMQGGSIPSMMGGAINPAKTYFPGSMIFFNPATQYFEPTFADNTYVTVGVLDSDSGIVVGSSVTGSNGFQTWIQKVQQGWAKFQVGTNSDAIPATTAPGTPVYAIDNQTVGLTDGSGTRPLAGKLVYVDSSSVPGFNGETGAWVEIRMTQGPLSTISGVTAVANGGTGVATLTAHGPLMGEGTAAIHAAAAGTSGDPFLSGGASADGAYGKLAPLGAAVAAVGGFGIAFRATVVLADSAGGATTNVAVPVKCEVTRIQVVKNTTLSASASDLVQVKNHGSGNALCGNLLLNVAASTIVNPTTLIAAEAVVALADGIDLVQPAHVTNNGCTVILDCIARA